MSAPSYDLTDIIRLVRPRPSFFDLLTDPFYRVLLVPQMQIACPWPWREI